MLAWPFKSRSSSGPRNHSTHLGAGVPLSCRWGIKLFFELPKVKSGSNSSPTKRPFKDQLLFMEVPTSVKSRVRAGSAWCSCYHIAHCHFINWSFCLVTVHPSFLPKAEGLFLGQDPGLRWIQENDATQGSPRQQEQPSLPVFVLLASAKRRYGI